MSGHSTGIGPMTSNECEVLVVLNRQLAEQYDQAAQAAEDDDSASIARRLARWRRTRARYWDSAAALAEKAEAEHEQHVFGARISL